MEVLVVSIEIEVGYKRYIILKDTMRDYLMQEAHWVRVLQNFFMIFADDKYKLTVSSHHEA